MLADRRASHALAASRCAAMPTHRATRPTRACSALGASARTGIVIVDHGSRRKASNDMLLEFVELFRASTPHAVVEPAHMEIAEPSIQQAIAKCVDQGASKVVVAPYFLSNGRHIQDDIPALVAEARQAFPQIECTIADPIGIDPLMVQLISNRVSHALAAAGEQAGEAAPPAGGGTGASRPTAPAGAAAGAS